MLYQGNIRNIYYNNRMMYWINVADVLSLIIETITMVVRAGYIIVHISGE